MHLSATTNFLVSCGRKDKVERLQQRQKLNFRHVHFLCDFCAISGGRKTRKAAARLLQGTQGVHTTDIIVCHPRILRKPQDYRKISVRFFARLRKNAAKRATTANNRTMVARLQCGNCKSYRFVATARVSIYRFF